MPLRIAFLTAQPYLSARTGDEPAIEALRARGHTVDLVPWRDAAVQWDQYNRVVIRSTWDYQHDLAGYLRCLDEISQQTQLLNPLPIVQWNARKTYLLELAARGFPIVPTIPGDGLTPGRLNGLFSELNTDVLILKPMVGASAGDTYRLLPGDVRIPEVAQRFSGRAWLAQPFLPQIVSEGEYSLVFFWGEFSHAVRKTPAPTDFRVQEEHGGQTNPVVPPPALLQLANQVLTSLDSLPLYARVDMATVAETGVLLELELIEPSLYLWTDPAAADRFAAAIARMA